MGRKKKPKHPYILSEMKEDDQRIGSLVDQGVSIEIKEINKRTSSNTSNDNNAL